MLRLIIIILLFQVFVYPQHPRFSPSFYLHNKGDIEFLEVEIIPPLKPFIHFSLSKKPSGNKRTRSSASNEKFLIAILGRASLGEGSTQDLVIFEREGEGYKFKKILIDRFCGGLGCDATISEITDTSFTVIYQTGDEISVTIIEETFSLSLGSFYLSQRETSFESEGYFQFGKNLESQIGNYFGFKRYYSLHYLPIGEIYDKSYGFELRNKEKEICLAPTTEKMKLFEITFKPVGSLEEGQILLAPEWENFQYVKWTFTKNEALRVGPLSSNSLFIPIYWEGKWWFTESKNMGIIQ